MSTVPPDLRLLQKPVHTLLSPASAGLPGDEALDIAIVREDWMRRRVRSHLLMSAERRSSLRYEYKSPLTELALSLMAFGGSLRVGTFNVNGKMPAQDLSPWLRGENPHDQFLPPLKEISPLSLSEPEQSLLSTGIGLSLPCCTCPQLAPLCRCCER